MNINNKEFCKNLIIYDTIFISNSINILILLIIELEINLNLCIYINTNLSIMLIKDSFIYSM
jgi:hypothetical protein